MVVYYTIPGMNPIELITPALASHGEGTIYRTKDPALVAKIFHVHDPWRIRKLEVMIAHPPVDPMARRGHVSFAWPKHLLSESSGKPAGYLMPFIRGSQTLQNVYIPKLRQRRATGVNWGHLHRVAQNIVSILDAIHAMGYVIGDIKDDNFLAGIRMLVSIIDTDSFQITDSRGGSVFRCPVGTIEFTPPELIGMRFTDLS